MERVLIVDDVEINRLILENILENDYETFNACDGVEAIDHLFSGKPLPDIVLLDIRMPEMDGYEVLEIMKNNAQTANIPVIFITADSSDINETKGLKSGAVDYVSKPFNPEVVKARIDIQIELKKYRDNLEIMVSEKVAELMSTRERMLESMATIIEYRNLESGQHVTRTKLLSKLIIDQLLTKTKYYKELTDNDYLIMIKAMPLHDIGKIGIPDHILLKPGKFDPEERAIMETHSIIGSNIIDVMMQKEDALYLKHTKDICRHHHEKWDGSGYPDKLAGEDIPLSARIIAIVDVYDALVSPRVYKPAMTHEDALGILNKDKGTHFDPYIIDTFVEMEERIKAFHLENP
ncbi:MAG: response regulator [Oscillospiraceae bacterium]|nr:response regulator [Oscillospiraceae bacterium]